MKKLLEHEDLIGGFIKPSYLKEPRKFKYFSGRQGIYLNTDTGESFILIKDWKAARYNDHRYFLINEETNLNYPVEALKTEISHHVRYVSGAPNLKFKRRHR